MSAESPAAILFDTTGNPIGVIIDGAIYRLQVEAKLTTGALANPIRIDPTGTTAQPITDNGGSITIDTLQLPSALIGGRLDVNIGTWLGSTAPSVGQKTMANSLPITVASDQSFLPTKEIRSTIGTTTTVAASASNVTLLASNADRLGATIFNDSATANLFVKLGATASTTSFTAKLGPGAYFEIPAMYTGIITGIWDVAVGNARITELTQ